MKKKIRFSNKKINENYKYLILQDRFSKFSVNEKKYTIKFIDTLISVIYISKNFKSMNFDNF